MLNILIGYDGKYVKANSIKKTNDKRTFRISSHIKSSLRGLLEKILPVASDYSNIVRFINENSKFSAGKVNQALAALFSVEVMEYMNNVLDLECINIAENLNLHTVWCVLQDTMNKMRILAKITDFINEESARGPNTLNILHRCTSNSLVNAEAEKICSKLTREASVPYFQMLEKWIYKGEIEDPFDEFMVTEKSDKEKVDWELKFELRTKYVPSFLRHDDKLIFNAGRYMYAIRKSLSNTEQVPCAVLEQIEYENVEFVYINMIRRGYNFANETLLTLLEGEDNACWLRTAKSFFSLEYDDIFYNIIGNCSCELEKPTDQIFLPYLQQLVDMSIRTSCFGELPFGNEYKVKLEKLSLTSQINVLNIQTAKVISEQQNGLEALTFTAIPPWPVRVIIHSKTLAGYQMLFRHIFYLKFVYMKLTWTRLINAPKSCHLLKHSMTVFVQTCLSFVTVDTTQTLWDKFENESRCVDSVVELIQLHNSYMYQTLMGCMLASTHIFHCLQKSLDICLKFCRRMDLSVEMEFENSLVALIKAASKETCWSPLIKALIPTFTDIPAVVELKHLCLY